MRVTIHQPEFMPWLGFFHKAGMADVLVLLDDAQFRKNYFHNRNRVRTREGWNWVTVPVEKAPLGTPMNEVRIADANNPRWREKMENAVRMSYGRAPHFEEVFDGLTTVLRQPAERLTEVNVPLLRWMLRSFGLSPEVQLSSAMDIESTSSRRILDICLKTGATTYVSGVSGPDYLDLPSFEQAGIAVEFQEFHHPIYGQLFPGFEAQMSAIDALFLMGAESNRLLRADWPDRIEQVFA